MVATNSGQQEMPTNINDLLRDASPEQRKWVAARLLVTSDAAAARDVHVDPTTVCRWSNKAQLDAAVELLLVNVQEAAKLHLQNAGTEAARVKVDGLKSRKENIRQDVATEILDRLIGKAAQPITGPEGGALIVNITRRD